jgi:hypothetical protein
MNNMGLMDIFKATENKKLKREVEVLKAQLTPEDQKAKAILNFINELENKKINLEIRLVDMNKTMTELDKQICMKKQDLVVLDEEILIQEFGLYKPMYNFATSDEYKNRLDSIRENQKLMIKDKTAVIFFEGWTVDGSKAKGKKMVDDNIRQIITTFNIECETIIDKVKFSNIESMRKRIEKSFDNLNKINETNRVSLTRQFLMLKLEELNLSYEYQVKKQEEKEEQKRIREELREQAKIQKELEEARKNIDKDLKHFTNALTSLGIQLTHNNITDDKKQELLNKKTDLESQIEILNKNLADVDYRQANQKAGYVYIISNIGAFGENIYKIGMTRRLEPQDRIDELSSASVPFNFDVHALIFADDAPSLENALHKAFDDKKINMMNKRKEFFNVTLDEIEKVVRENFDKTIEFKRIAEAEHYRESLKMKEVLNR